MSPISRASNGRTARATSPIRPFLNLARSAATSRHQQHFAHIPTLFNLCGVLVVLPFFDIPFIGLSVTAPLMLPVMYYALFRPSSPWFRRYRGWILLAMAVWLGIAVSFFVNGPWFRSREFKAIEIASLVRYLFWLTVFLVTGYVASDIRIQRRLPFLLGSAVVVLAGMRCFEGIVLGKVGAWTNTVFTTQNSYGILFSTFTPFLFPVFIGRGLIRKLLCAGGLFAVLFACAINGSRGSWICISLALAVFFVLGLLSRPQSSLRLILPVGFAALAFTATLVGSTRVREAVLDRFSTFDNLEKDKSYMVRQVMNQRSLKLFALYPWFGTGPGRYRAIPVALEMPRALVGRSDEDFMRKSPHNSYLSYLAEGGLMATVSLAALLAILAIRGALAAMTLNRQGEHWALGVYASFVAMSVHFWSLAGLSGTHAFFVYGLLAATIVIASGAHQTQGIQRERAQLRRRRFPFRPSRPAVGNPAVSSRFSIVNNHS